MEFLFALNTRKEKFCLYKSPFISLFQIKTPQAFIDKHSTNDLDLRMVNALPLIHQPDSAVQKANDMSAADWQ